MFKELSSEKFEEISSEKLIKQLNAIKSISIHNVDDIAFQNAASVLISFDPNTLKPLNIGEKKNSHRWESFLKYSEPLFDEASGNWWQLKYIIRRQALTRLANEQVMIKAIEANPDRNKNSLQKIFEKILKQEKINLFDLTREELAVHLNLLEWVDGILPISDRIEEIRQILKKKDLFAPMHRLVDDGFVGRKKELTELEEYIGINSSANLLTRSSRFFLRLFSNLNHNPPYLVYGPGGIGKSSLLAKLILDHAESTFSEPLPFAYLNIDSAFLDVERPETFIIEAARQLAVQIPEKENDLLNLHQDIIYRSDHSEGFEYSKGYFGFSQFVGDFGEIIKKVTRPVLLVVDTFEEAQYLGKEIVHIIWNLLAALQQAAPNVRTIVAGRVMISDFPVLDRKLSEFSQAEANQLLVNYLSVLIEDKKHLKKIVQDIINTVGLNPLSLRLAAKIVQDQGITMLKSIETREWLVLKVRAEVIQSRLYGRILAHIHDEEVRKLAYPGLIVRRITSEIILEVLAAPCNINVSSTIESKKLYEKFKKEVSLMEENYVDQSLHHRQDIRRTMLPDLKNNISPDLIKQIHDAAVLYYSSLNNLVSTAEEIYHRLSRGDQPQDLESLWQEGIEKHLQSALVELDGRAKLWLSNKLHVTPDDNLLKEADLQEWEEITKKTVERYLKSGYAEDALAVLHSRKERSLGSPLYRMEMEALRIQGKYNEVSLLADKAIEEALKASKADSVTSNLYELSLQAALAKESLGLLEDALKYVDQAEDFFGKSEDHLSELRILITHTRILRKLGENKDVERNKLIEIIKEIVLRPTVIDEMRNYPALFREIVAEVGKLLPDILQKALDWFGVEITNKEQVEVLAQALSETKNAIDKDINDTPDFVDLETDYKFDSFKQSNFSKENIGRNLNSTIKIFRDDVLNDESQDNSSLKNLDSAVIDVFRSNVDSSLNSNG